MQKRNRVFWITLILLMFGLGVTRAQDAPAENPFLHLLHYLPFQSPLAYYPQMVFYGDVELWRESWDMPAVHSQAEMQALEDDYARNYWQLLLPKQVFTKASAYQFYVDQNGFSLFDVQRSVYTVGLYEDDSNTDLSVFQLSDDSLPIVQAFAAEHDYVSSLLGDEVQLYEPPIPTLGPFTLGNDGLLTQSTSLDTLTNSRNAGLDEYLSLADNETYANVITALDSSELDYTGDLLGAVLLDGAAFALLGPAVALPPKMHPDDRPEAAQQIVDEYPPLPEFDAVVFATMHSEDSIYQIVVVGFPYGTDAEAAANALARRLENYDSLQHSFNYFDEYNIQLDRIFASENTEFPTAVVVMRVPEPPLEFPAGSVNLPNSVPTNVPNWYDIAISLDCGFLAVTVGY